MFVLGVTAGPLYLAFGVDGLWASVSFASTYVTYEVIHRRLHTHPGATAYGRWAQRHHLHHHRGSRHHRRRRHLHGIHRPHRRRRADDLPWDALHSLSACARRIQSH